MKYIKNRKGPFPNNDNVKWETLDGKARGCVGFLDSWTR